MAAFGAMLVFYIFSQFEKARDRVVKLLGYLLLIVATLAFVFIIATVAWLALTCGPRLMAHVYGVAEVCYRNTPPSPPKASLPAMTSILSLYMTDVLNKGSAAVLY